MNLFNTPARRVAVLHDGPATAGVTATFDGTAYPAGPLAVSFDGSRVPAGVYVVRAGMRDVSDAVQVLTRRIVVVR